MADSKVVPTDARSDTEAPLDDRRSVMLEAFAMVAILSSVIGEGRLFESTEGRRTPLLETPLPRLREMLPVLDSVLASQPAWDPESVPTPIEQHAKQHRLIGFRAFTSALRIPEDQFDGDSIVPGVADVLALFARSPDQPIDHRAPWAFLNSDLYRGDRHPRPIDRLRAAARTGETSTLLSEFAGTKESLDRGDHF